MKEAIMNRRGFLSCSALAPLAAAAGLVRRGRYRQASEEPPSGRPLPTGLADLDAVLRGGLPAAGVTLILGRDSLCAEALLLNLAERHLHEDAAPVAYVSAWHSRERIVDRLAFVRSGLDRFAKRRGLWAARQENAFREARDQILRSQLHYEDARRLRSLSDVAASLSQVRRAHGLRLVVLDNAFWFAEGVGQEAPEAEAQAIGCGLRATAALLGVPLIALCPIPLAESDEGSQISLQPALGQSAGILEHCAACLAVRFEVIGSEGASVQVEFHTTASRGDVSFHSHDRGSGRISDWA
jgi:hypothetical protein